MPLLFSAPVQVKHADRSLLGPSITAASIHGARSACRPAGDFYSSLNPRNEITPAGVVGAFDLGDPSTAVPPLGTSYFFFTLTFFFAISLYLSPPPIFELRLLGEPRPVVIGHKRDLVRKCYGTCKEYLLPVRYYSFFGSYCGALLLLE